MFPIGQTPERERERERGGEREDRVTRDSCSLCLYCYNVNSLVQLGESPIMATELGGYPEIFSNSSWSRISPAV